MSAPVQAPTQIVAVGNDLAVAWPDGREDYLGFELLRRNCPCAQCKGERDILGNVYRGPRRPLVPASFALRAWTPVGNYAIQLFWSDGHSDGIYSFEYLRELGAA
jgi:DUF971 family protein